MKVSELQGAALDWAVNQIEECCDDPFTPMFSTDWTQGGPIIERENISLRYDCIDISKGMCGWVAESWAKNGEHFEESGPTPLIAAMRCYVASQLGSD